MIASIFKRIFYPHHLWRILTLGSKRESTARASADPQLKLFADIFPGGFLHYGYFDNPDTLPQDISLSDVVRAQRRHSEWVLTLIADRASPVLDVGCGMGGLIGLMLEEKLNPVALSPDRNQISHVKEKYSQVPAIEAKFEDMSAERYMGHFGTVITSESLQYLDLTVSLPLIAKLLKPGGRWIAYDYFCIGSARKKSGHQLADFKRRVSELGWKFVHEQDHTPHVLPTLRYLHMWGHDIVRPVVNFSFDKLKRKLPRLYYILEDAVETLYRKFDRNLSLVSPDVFTAEKKYMLFAIERDETAILNHPSR